MTLIFVTFLIADIFGSTMSDNVTSINPKIFGGNQTEIHSAPYHAQIVHKGDQICGAAIISNSWLISAAHCFYHAKRIVVRTGSKRRSEGEKHKVERVFIPTSYNTDTLEDDISLILLKEPINFNVNQSAIGLYSRSPRPGDVILISGFGQKNEQQHYATILITAEVPVVNYTTCARRHSPDVITDKMFCAGIGKTDACEGDSGGPAVIDNKLVGIISWGRKCGSNYYPGVYTNVYKYRKFITKITGIKF